MQLLFYPNTGIFFLFFKVCVRVCVSSRILLTHPSAVVEVVISYAMGTSDNTHVSNLKCCHYLMCFFCVSLYCFFLFFFFFFKLPHGLSSSYFASWSWSSAAKWNEPFCSKPQTTCCTPRRNRFETVRQQIHLPQGLKLLDFETLSALPYFKPVISSKWKTEKKSFKKQKPEHSCFIVREGAKWELYWTFWTWIWGKCLVLGELPLRYSVGFFGTFSLS